MTQVVSRPSRVLAATLAVALTVVIAGAALAQASLALIIQQMQLDEDGLTQVTVQVTGLSEDTVLDEGSFSVTENGRAIPDVTVVAGRPGPVPPAVHGHRRHAPGGPGRDGVGGRPAGHLDAERRQPACRGRGG
jgi:hypothetical protein